MVSGEDFPINQSIIGYPLAMTNNSLLKMAQSKKLIYPVKMMIFHACVLSGNQTWRAGKWTIHQ